MRKLWLLLFVPLVLVATACNNYSTESDSQAVHIKGGPLSDNVLENCIPPSKKGRDGILEDHVYYPTSTRNYRALEGESEAPPFDVVSKDNAQMYVPMTVTFTLTTDCEQLKEFHSELGNRFGAGGGSGGDPLGSGWVPMLDFVMGVPADTLLDRIAQEHNWRNLWNDPATKAAVEKEVKDRLPGMVAAQAGGDFFNIHNVVVLKPEPVDQQLTDAINQEQSTVATANAQEAQARADEARARAQIAVAQAEAEKKRQEILGYKLEGMTNAEAVRAYLEAQMLVQGLNPYQPGGNPLIDQR